MPNPNKNLGRKVEWHNGTAFAEVLGIVDAPTVSREPRDKIATHDLATTLSAPRPHMAGLRGAVTIAFTIKFDKDDTVHAALLADAIAGTERQVKLTRSDATPSFTTWTQALVDIQEQGGGMDQLALAAVTILAYGTETEG